MGKLLGIKQLCNLVQSLKALFVKKIGDTMSGALNWIQAGQTLNTIQNTDLDMRANAAALSATESLGGFQWRDSNGELNGYIEVKRARNNNNVYLQFNVRRYSSDGQTNINNGFYLEIDDNLNPIVSFTTEAAKNAWLTALGIGTMHIDGITSGTRSIASGTPIVVKTLTLEPGTWAILGQINYGAGGTAGTYRIAWLGTASEQNAYGQRQEASPTTGNTVMQIMGIQKLTATTNVNMTAIQGSGATINIINTSTWLIAVRICS